MGLSHNYWHKGHCVTTKKRVAQYTHKPSWECYYSIPKTHRVILACISHISLADLHKKIHQWVDETLSEDGQILESKKHIYNIK